MINPSCPDYSNTPVSPRRPRMDYLPSDPHATPWVTVITPFYNTPEVFHETAQCVLQQSLQQWEWIIINDCSQNPESLAVLDQYRKKDPRIRVIDHPVNKGPGAARNTGFREARSEYVFQLDADDLIEPTTLEKMAWYLFTHPDAAFVDGHKLGFGSEQYLWTRGFYCGKEFLEENLATVTCMVRKSSHAAVGGYDESNRAGMEDWDFWLKVAHHGQWGGTIPEFFDWYRRRAATNREHWSNILEKKRFTDFHGGMKERYAKLWQNNFPAGPVTSHQPYQPISEMLPGSNVLQKNKRRLLCIFPHLELGGADKFNLDLLKLLINKHGYEVTIVTTLAAANRWKHLFQALTPDIFILSNFLHFYDCPRFIRYLMQSRQFDVVFVSNSVLGYQLMPYIRSHFPKITIVDYIHMEEDYWRFGGYGRYSLNYQNQTDLTLVTSEHLKNWLVERGGDRQRIEVCYINVDSKQFSRNASNIPALRRKWNLSEELPTVVYAARICEQKQPKVFAQVMEKLAARGVKFQTIVAGDGPLLPWLQEFFRQKKISQVKLLGPVLPDVMIELLALSDIFFLPSKMEGIALVYYEAMSMGVVPVGAAVGGQKELVTPDCGVLLEPGIDQVDQYVATLEALLSNSERRTKMSEHCRDRIVQHFQLEQMGVRMDELLTKARCLAQQEPRTAIPAQLAATLMIEAIEQTRLEHLLEGGWHSQRRRGSLPLAASEPFLQIFVSRNGMYSEEDSFHYHLNGSSVSTCRLQLEDGLGDGPLRLDPVNFPGAISINRICISRSDDNAVIWCADNKSSFNSVRVDGTAVRVGKGDTLRVLCYANDPRLYLPKIDAPVDVPLILDVEFEVLNPADFAASNRKLVAFKEPFTRKALRTISNVKSKLTHNRSKNGKH